MTRPIQCLLLTLLLPMVCAAQLSGRVLDEKGEPLPYATVYVRNTTNGTVANAAGEYRLAVPEGAQEVVFQYIGYITKVEAIRVGKKNIVLDARLEPSDLTISEVVITGEDPAVRIMREVIAKRTYYKNKVDRYSCDVYIKGFHKLLDHPGKLFGISINDVEMKGDTNKSQVIYLSESVSKVYAQAAPARKKEVMISSRVSGSDGGYSFNRATFTEFDLYNEKLDIIRDILSPLADNAFSYYNFKWEGSYTDLNGYTIEKIKVIPKRPADPTFSGHLYVVDSWWNLAGFDLTLTGAAVKQPIVDTLNIRQAFVLVEKPDTWRPLNQLTDFKLNLLGFKIGGFFNSVFSNYDLNPGFDNSFFDQELFKVDKIANTRDTAYWATVRPIPLTLEEQEDYQVKDSISRVHNSKPYMDSLDRKRNRFKFNNLWGGYTWRNSYEHRSISYPGIAQWVQFNTVQGLVLNVQPEWAKDSDSRGNKRWRAIADLNYGFSETKFRAWAGLNRRFESIHYTTLDIAGGTRTMQFNDRNPIGPVINAAYSLLLERNYLKLYDKAFGKIGWSRVLTPSIVLSTSLEYAQRKPLTNHSDKSWRKGDESRYTPNTPVPALQDQAEFAAPDMLALDVKFEFRIGQKYSSYPDYRVYTGSNWPEFSLRYKKALAGVLGADADFDFIQLKIDGNSLSWGLAGYSEWSASAGLFIRNKSLSFMDLYHPMGNLTIFGPTDKYEQQFLILPYYAFSTDQPYAEAHWQHHMQGWLLDKIPLIRKLNWKEVFGASVYYADQLSLDPLYTGKLPYWELNAGFENIGIKPLRPLGFRVDVVWGFLGKSHFNTGVVLAIGI